MAAILTGVVLIINNGRTDCQVSRSVLLTGTALVLSAAAGVTAVTQASAQQKISQADAKYQGTPKPFCCSAPHFTG
jgi:hypothetical protein